MVPPAMAERQENDACHEDATCKTWSCFSYQCEPVDGPGNVRINEWVGREKRMMQLQHKVPGQQLVRVSTITVELLGEERSRRLMETMKGMFIRGFLVIPSDS